jgi:hypothetical protein
MPLDYVVLPSRRAIVVRGDGVVALRDHEQLVARLLQEPALEEGLPVLVDGRGITSATIDVADLPHVVTLTRLLTKRGLDIIAIVTPVGPVRILARAFELGARAVGVHASVFDELPPALVWLRLEPRELENLQVDAPEQSSSG